MPLNNPLIGAPMLIDLTLVDDLNPYQIGGKAYNLAFLHSHGLPVPHAIVIPHDIDMSEPEFTDILYAHRLFIDSQKLFAVRSSGIGEDSKSNSYAGMFDTYLNVPVDQIISRINDVRDSVSSARGKQYSSQRGVAISAMSVVVQEMVEADYAGVAFSTSPIENDARIALLEIVPGLGEALVSGKTTPTTIRYNKLTKQYRIQQEGTDPISDFVISDLLAQLMPLLQVIENAYNHSVDVEWAYANGKVHVLQARPITA